MSKKDEALKLAMNKAFQLGQRYWSWADSEYSSHWKKADAAKSEFDQLVQDTIDAALAEQDDPDLQDKAPELVEQHYKQVVDGVQALFDAKRKQPAQQQEPVASKQTFTRAEVIRAIEAERHACSIAVWMTLMEATEPDADDKGLAGWMTEAEQRIKNRSSNDPEAAQQQEPLTPREVELLDGMIEVQLHHASQCDGIANRAMAEKQKVWDMERVKLLRKLKAAHGITGEQK